MSPAPAPQILICDSNIVYAKMARDAIQSNIPRAVIDIASDKWIAEHRLRQSQYGLVLCDGNDRSFHDVLANADTTVVYWSLQPHGEMAQKPDPRRLQEGLIPEELREVAGFAH